MNVGHEPDEWLMGQVALDKREYLGTLVRRYASSLLTYIERMIGNRHRSEELFQEVFLRVWTKRDQYRFPRPSRAWLFAIAMNHCRAEFRKVRAPEASLDDGSPFVPVSAGPGPSEAAIATENATIVADAVAQLPAGQRTVVVLRVWNGLPYAEIAAIVGRSEATVRSHMHHALTSMRRYLEPRM